MKIKKTKKNSNKRILLATGLVIGGVVIFAALTVGKWDDYLSLKLPTVKPSAEAVPTLYQGVTNTNLMPHDLTFNGKYDVPILIENLQASEYRAVYIDKEMNLRVKLDNTVQISEGKDSLWKDYDAEDVGATEFAKWLLIHDPIPGYSMKEVQHRLANGAEVKHIVFGEGKEMYFIIDQSGVQIELVQEEKISSVLVDGQRMMITYAISASMLQSFYDLLVSNNILSEADAEQDYAKRMKVLEEDLPNFLVANRF